MDRNGQQMHLCMKRNTFGSLAHSLELTFMNNSCSLSSILPSLLLRTDIRMRGNLNKVTVFWPSILSERKLARTVAYNEPRAKYE